MALNYPAVDYPQVLSSTGCGEYLAPEDGVMDQTQILAPRRIAIYSRENRATCIMCVRTGRDTKTVP